MNQLFQVPSLFAWIATLTIHLLIILAQLCTFDNLLVSTTQGNCCVGFGLASGRSGPRLGNDGTGTNPGVSWPTPTVKGTGTGIRYGYQVRILQRNYYHLLYYLYTL